MASGEAREELVWVTVARFPPEQANRARARLQSAGISALVLDTHTAAVRPALIDLAGGCRVQVLREDVEVAEEILHAFVAKEDARYAALRAAEPYEHPSRSSLLHRALVFAVIGVIVPLISSAVSFWYIALFLKDRRPSRWTDWVIFAGALLINLAALVYAARTWFGLT